MTPPALARMSGIDEDAALVEVRCASGVVGPLAPSATIFARDDGRVRPS